MNRIKTNSKNIAKAFLLFLILSSCSEKGNYSSPIKSKGIQNPPGSQSVALPDGFGNLSPNKVFFSSFEPINSTALYGSGYDSVSSNIRARCVDGTQKLETIVGDSTNPDGQSVSYDFRQATSVYQLRKSLNIDANASFGIGIYSGSGSAHFFESSSLNSMTSYLIIDVTVVNQIQTLNRKLMADFAKAKMNDPVAFRATCGDRFVDGVKTGGQFTAVVKFSAKSEEYKRELDAKISGSVSSFYSGSISFSQMLQSLSSSSNFTIEILRKGGNQPIPSLNDLDKYAREFPRVVNPKTGSPWPIEAITMDYNIVEDYSGATDFSYPVAVTQMERLAQARDEALQRRNDIIMYLTSPDDFGAVDQAKAKQDEAALNSYLTSLVELARNCTSYPQNGCTSPIPPMPTLVSGGSQGQTGGSASIDALEKLFEARGNPANVENILNTLTRIDLKPLSGRDRYRAQLLLARAYFWKASFGHPEGIFVAPQPLPGFPEFMNDDVLRFRQALASADSAAAKLPSLGSATCELNYLKALNDFSKRPIPIPPTEARFDQETPALISKFEGLRTLTMLDKSACSTFDGYGIDRVASRLNSDMAFRALSRPNNLAEGKRYWLKAIEHIRQANFKAPEHPGNPMAFPLVALNFTVFGESQNYGNEGCRALDKFVKLQPSGPGLGLQPLYSVAQEQGRHFLANSPCFVLLGGN